MESGDYTVNNGWIMDVLKFLSGFHFDDIHEIQEI